MTDAFTTFKAFHARDAGDPVYPLQNQSSGLLQTKIKIPRLMKLGKAIRVLYQSDKWNSIGDTVVYYHDHGPGDGNQVFSPNNKTMFYAPYELFKDELSSQSSSLKLPVKWSHDMVLLGECTGWYVSPKEGSEELLEAQLSDSILVSSPHGFVSKSDPYRVYLAIIDLPSSKLEGLIIGPELRLTEDGIEG